MCVVRGAKWIYRQFFPKKEQKPLIPKNKMVILRADGSWILDDNKPPTPKIIPTPNVSAWHSYGPLDPISHVEVEMRHPPSLFPFAQELENKLSECLVAGVISSCVHTKTGNETYILTIEIPYSKDKVVESTQLNLFVKAMRDKYQLQLLKRQKQVSSVSAESYHMLVFEYDPRKKMFEEKK
jgi:hypothetical protein